MNLAEAEVNNENTLFLIYSPNDQRPARHPRMIPCLPPSSSFFRPASLPPSLPSDLPPSAAALAMMKGGIEAECSIIPLFPGEKRNGEGGREREAGREGGKKRNFVRNAWDGRAGERAVFRQKCKSGRGWRRRRQTEVMIYGLQTASLGSLTLQLTFVVSRT